MLLESLDLARSRLSSFGSEDEDEMGGHNLVKSLGLHDIDLPVDSGVLSESSDINGLANGSSYEAVHGAALLEGCARGIFTDHNKTPENTQDKFLVEINVDNKSKMSHIASAEDMGEITQTPLIESFASPTLVSLEGQQEASLPVYRQASSEWSESNRCPYVLGMFDGAFQRYCVRNLFLLDHTCHSVFTRINIYHIKDNL